MKRYDAIKIVSDSILKDGLVEALFLKGSIARNEDDYFSDVDMYALVSLEKESSFLDKRIEYLKSYMPLIYWSESNFVGPQIVGVFENALHFDLYTVKIDNFPQTDDIQVIFDKNEILKSYKKKSLSINTSDVALEFDEFTFSLLELEIAYCRGDIIWAVRLASVLTGHLSLILRYIYDKENSRLGTKRLYKYMPKELMEEYIDILNYLTPAFMRIGINKLINFANCILNKLPNEIQKQINISFFNMMKKRLEKLLLIT
jgi:predicted nucleotidyltransferase